MASPLMLEALVVREVIVLVSDLGCLNFLFESILWDRDCVSTSFTVALSGFTEGNKVVRELAKI